MVLPPPGGGTVILLLDLAQVKGLLVNMNLVHHRIKLTIDRDERLAEFDLCIPVIVSEDGLDV